MKEVLVTLLVLLAVMFGFYWASNRNLVKKDGVQTISEREIYLQMPEKMVTGEETEVKLMAKYSEGKIVSYVINFTYDPAVIKVINVEVNKEIFDKKAEVKVDEGIGKVMMTGENIKNRDKLVSGDVVLATMKIKGLRKGGTMIYSSRRPETGILEGGKVVEGNFQMPNFKVNFL